MTAESLASALADRYRIERELGQGGMATVYLAEDVRHHRKVAIKVLRPELAAVIGAERFVREIQTIAALQHPHILGLIDSGEVQGTAYYVMPFVEGESLRDRLNREKQLSVSEAVRIAGEVASALDYAHRHGVIHRDIKPENILMHDGQALVADFGIALAASAAGGSRMTETGMSLGTPHYMSPEQAMGEREITARSDIYALGCVAYEMLVGEPPFTGPTAQAIVARMMTEEPRSLTVQRKTVPPTVDDAVLTALAKLPADRFASAAEFASVLRGEVAAHRPMTTEHRAARPGRNRSSLLWFVAGAAAVLGLTAVAAWGWMRPRSISSPGLVTYLPPPPGVDFGGGARFAALSPDGTRLTFVGFSEDGGSQLWVWNLATRNPVPLEGTAGAQWPFWSPDGASVGFFARGWLSRIPVKGGGAVPLCKVAAPRGATWSSSGQIVYATGHRLMGYDPGSGQCRVVSAGDSVHAVYRPNALPDGRHYVFAVMATDANSGLYILDGKSGTVTRFGDGLFPEYVAPGFLLFESFKENSAALLAQRFDPARGVLMGSPVLVADSVWEPSGMLSYSASAQGTIIYREGQPDTYNLLADRSGRILDTLRRSGTWTHAFAHQHNWVAMGGVGLWLVDLSRGSISSLGSGLVPNPVWSPGDTALAFSDGCGVSVTGVAEARKHPLLQPAQADGFDTGCLEPTSWTPDGHELLITIGRGDSVAASQIWRYRFADSSFMPLIAGDENYLHGTVSPDGRWLTYVSDATGAYEVYVAPYGGQSRGRRVSNHGGFWPRWRADGREVLYYAPNGMITAVAVSNGSGDLTLGTPAPLFRWPFVLADLWLAAPFDVSPDGLRFVLHPASAAAGRPLVVMLNWPKLVGLVPR